MANANSSDLHDVKPRCQGLELDARHFCSQHQAQLFDADKFAGP